MRETRNAQMSVFDFYAKHEHGTQLKDLSDILDDHPQILELIELDLREPDTTSTGACGMSIESILRCLLLKQILGVSYEKLAFHLSDSLSYRTFARLKVDRSPSRSGLQSTIRRVSAQTLQKMNQLLMTNWLEAQSLSLDSLRIDSTVVASNIAPPIDSQMLNDGVRVLSRSMAACKNTLGVRIRFTDQRKRSKSLAFHIFNAKKTEKRTLYPKLLACAATAIKQSTRAIESIRHAGTPDDKAALGWIDHVEHFQSLLRRVIDQTQRRVLAGESVPASEKIVSLFEAHTDIIIKNLRDVQYGHKVNLATQGDGFITYLRIEDGNPADKNLFMPVLAAYQEDYARLPLEVVADGGYASQVNARDARTLGIKRVVFNKPVGLSLRDMGVKRKTFEKLRNFRAGIEGNISELKRAFGASKATWKGLDGFKAYVWASVLSYNLIRMIRFSSA